MGLTLKEYTFKITMLGDSAVGKSSLLHRYTKDVYMGNAICLTIAAAMFTHTLEMEPGVCVKLHIWDTAGLERFRSLTRSYFRGSVGGLLVFDLTNRASFDHIKAWHHEVCESQQSNKVWFVLVGQKSDSDSHRREVSPEEAEKLAEQLGMPYVETSAKTGQNVREAFENLAQQVYQGLLSGEVEAPEALQLCKASMTQASSTTKENKCCA